MKLTKVELSPRLGHQTNRVHGGKDDGKKGMDSGKKGMDGGKKGIDAEKRAHRRVWTKNEEETLLSILEKVVSEGGRCDNGTFKAGTLRQIEKELNLLLPNSGLKADPHIDSKQRKWKKQQRVIFDMLRTNGFRWNDVNKCVEVDDDEVWQSYVQAHSEARGWRDKPFPIYERLVYIYGKDCTTRRWAETPADMVEEIKQEETQEENHVDDIDVENLVNDIDVENHVNGIDVENRVNGVDVQDCVNGVDIWNHANGVDVQNHGNGIDVQNHVNGIDVGEAISPMSAHQPSSSHQLNQTSTKPSRRKRARSESILREGLKEISSTIQRVFNLSFQNVEMLAKRILIDREDRSDIVDELATMGLNQDDELEALCLILEKPSNVSAFKSLRGARRLAFVRKLLQERVRG